MVVLLFDESNTTDGVVIGTYGTATWKQHDRLYASDGTPARVSIDSSGTQCNGSSYESSISGDGRTVAFDSHASNLVANDTNGWEDIFVHDRHTGTTARVSVDSAGAQSDDDSGEPSISADGRYVAFRSYATNLVTGDTNGVRDIFVHDRETGTTSRISVDSAGAQSDGTSGGPSISADGRFVAFRSYATNLVTGDTNDTWDIFVHDRQTPPNTTRVSVHSDGTQADNASAFPAVVKGAVVFFGGLALCWGSIAALRRIRAVARII